MGTSQSSDGPGPGVPMIPPWVPELPTDDRLAPEGPEQGNQPADEGSSEQPGDDGEQEGTTRPGPVRTVPLAPPARFYATRLNLGSFARSGDARDMRRGLGHYIKTGYGGAGTASRRLSGTATTAGALDRALSGLAAGEALPGSAADRKLLEGRSADEVMDAVVEAVRPVDGTLDAEASRAAARDALAEVLTRFPEADLLTLTPEQRALAIERFTACDVFRRIQLDVGKAIYENAPTASVALSRLKQVRDYIKETVAASFRRLRDAGRAITAGGVERLVRDAIRETVQVFEGFAE